MNKTSNQLGDAVQFLADEILIQGEPQIIICASAFYFRIPKGEWRDRLTKVKAAGYNCIDVYFPWNYHETEEGCWDFSGEKDASAYLALAAELGLFVIARPGPYICSEWDMGSLPAYLLTKEDLVVRDFNKPYLDCVKTWYDKILPILSKYQIGKEGTIIAMQLENELDFYDCNQVEPYISFLKSYARASGMEVPLLVCAGQCDIKSAGGLIEGVMPAINLYPGIGDKYFEDKVKHYVDTFKEMNLPLCITETHQLHFILRRELIAGAKLIAAYNQVSGTDFGFTTSVNNWGSPLTYMTHDYHFNGMINPQGECLAEYEEALLFCGVVKTFEAGISKGNTQKEEILNISGECVLSSGIEYSLKLYGGGKLAAIANIDEKPGKVQFTYEGTSCPQFTQLLIEPMNCPILPFDIPLHTLGIDFTNGKLAYSTAELFKVKKEENNKLCFYTQNEGEIALNFEETVTYQCTNMEAKEKEGLYILTFQANEEGTAVFTSKTGKKVTIYGLSKESAIALIKAEIPGSKENVKSEKSVNEKEASSSLINQLENMSVKLHILEGMGEEIGRGTYENQDRILPMEDMGFYRGYGWYEGSIAENSVERIKGYLIYNGMDVLNIYRNNEYLDTVIGDETFAFIPENQIFKDRIKLGIRCEIWGHSNFSDSRLPAMDIRRKKGIQGFAAISGIRDITDNWLYLKKEEGKEEVSLLNEKDNLLPLIGIGGYNNPEQPQAGIYRKKIKRNPKCNTAYLIFEGLSSEGKVYADGKYLKSIQPYDRAVAIEKLEKDVIEIAVYLRQKMIQESNELKIFLYEGTELSEIKTCGAEERKIAAFMEDNRKGETAKLHDLHVESGKVSALHGKFTATEEEKESLKLKITGKNAKLLVLLNGIMLGRIWLPCDKVRPEFKGGNDSILYLPKSFMKEENTLDFLVEGLSGEAYIEEVIYTPVKE